jgi:O-6-methylguanine DNA methyltransferase
MSVNAVKTTGIFCRDGCPASPKPEHVLRLDSPVDALYAGYRPCLRCRPEVPDSPRAQRGLRRVGLLSNIRHPRRVRPEEGVVRLTLLDTPLGPMVGGVAADGLALLEFADRPMLETQLDIVQRRFRARLEPGRTDLHDRAQDALDRYFAGKTHSFHLPLAAPGTPFQERVWGALRGIPAGDTRSYSALATEVGQPSAVRAVGHANGMNRLAVVIPCHRVIASDGGLGGYGGGTWRKAWLLNHERGAGSRPNL